jgi:hypothetical protein
MYHTYNNKKRRNALEDEKLAKHIDIAGGTLIPLALVALKPQKDILRRSSSGVLKSYQKYAALK